MSSYKKSFGDIPISTRTIIVTTGVELNIQNLYKNLPVTEYKIEEKKRGRKKKDVINNNIVNNIPNGSIISIKYQDGIRGVELKKKKRSSKFFRNAVTVIMFISNKLVNLKISTNGKVQVTGCKYIDYCKQAMIYLFDIILKSRETYIVGEVEQYIDIIFNNVMTNKDFFIGFNVNRQNLDKIINSDTSHNSILETSFGYTGVNLKMSLGENRERTFDCLKINTETKESTDYKMYYSDYIKKLNSKELEKEHKRKYITFLIFQSGNIIMSGINEVLMEEYYNIFYDIIDKNINEIKQD